MASKRRRGAAPAQLSAEASPSSQDPLDQSNLLKRMAELTLTPEQLTSIDALLRGTPRRLAEYPLDDLASAVALICDTKGWLVSDTHLPCPRTITEEMRALVVNLLRQMRLTGCTPCVPARPEIVEFACTLLAQLMRDGMITHCDISPLRCLLVSHSPHATVEDWKPTTDYGNATRAEEIDSSAGTSNACPLLHLSSYLKANMKMSCTGAMTPRP